MATCPPLRPALRPALSSPRVSPSLGGSTPLPDSSASSTSHIHFDSGTIVRPSHSRNGSFTQSRAGSSSQEGHVKYKARVGFEAFEDSSDDALFSFTLQTASENYVKTRESRVFLVCVSPDESGVEALDFLMESLLDDGDEVVALRVFDIDDSERDKVSRQEELREEARELRTYILQKNDEVEDRKISVIVEFVAGKVTDSIMRLLALYRPDSLIVGTKGSRGKLAAWGAVLGAPGMGSVSRYCISHSPVPVVVVRPEAKVKKSMAKRQSRPKRYTELMGGQLTRSKSAGGA